jgi:hypothetical protein
MRMIAAPSPPIHSTTSTGQDVLLKGYANFLKTVCWTGVFLCILSIGSASDSFNYLPADAIHCEYVEIMGMGTTVFSNSPIVGSSATQPE